MSHSNNYNWNDCWQELNRLRREMHRLFERMRTISPDNNSVSANVKNVSLLAMEFAAEVVGVHLKKVQGKCRKNDVAWARHIAMYCTRQFTGATLKELTRAFHFHDHNTIIYALKKVRREPLPQYRAQVDAVAEKIRCALVGRPLFAAGKAISPQRLKKLMEEKA